LKKGASRSGRGADNGGEGGPAVAGLLGEALRFPLKLYWATCPFFVLIAAIFFAVLTFPITGFALNDTGVSSDISVSQYPEEVPVGDAVIITLKLKERAKNVSGFCYNKKVFFFKKGRAKNVFYAFVGTNVSQEETSTRLALTIDYARGISKGYDFDIKVKKVKYPEEKLKLPKKMVEPPEEVLDQIKAEREAVLEIYSKTRTKKQFDSAFIVPLASEVSSTFGKRRILNGIKKSPHSGIDLRGDIGTAIKASNSGTVVFARSLYFTGNTIIIDHGLGLYTAYFHLDEIYKSEQEDVAKGEDIGTLGMSGRATGPHLHFGVKLNGFYVNPFSVISLTEEIYPEKKSAENISTR
jgi:murein DD-endopeptidase MepM/ murein hydrolase activator NlpD